MFVVNKSKLEVKTKVSTKSKAACLNDLISSIPLTVCTLCIEWYYWFDFSVHFDTLLSPLWSVLPVQCSFYDSSFHFESKVSKFSEKNRPIILFYAFVHTANGLEPMGSFRYAVLLFVHTLDGT